jgi:hypothetical protein
MKLIWCFNRAPKGPLQTCLAKVVMVPTVTLEAGVVTGVDMVVMAETNSPTIVMAAADTILVDGTTTAMSILPVKCVRKSTTLLIGVRTDSMKTRCVRIGTLLVFLQKSQNHQNGVTTYII